MNVIELSKKEYADKVLALNDTASAMTSQYAEECSEFANFNAILAVDESGIFYLVESTFKDVMLLPEGYPSSISVYEKNIFDSIEVATFFMRNTIPHSQLPLHVINPTELTNLQCVYIIKN